MTEFFYGFMAASVFYVLCLLAGLWAGHRDAVSERWRSKHVDD